MCQVSRFNSISILSYLLDISSREEEEVKVKKKKNSNNNKRFSADGRTPKNLWPYLLGVLSMLGYFLSLLNFIFVSGLVSD